MSIDGLVEEEAERWEPESVFKLQCQPTLEDGRGLGIFRILKTGS